MFAFSQVKIQIKIFQSLGILLFLALICRMACHL